MAITDEQKQAVCESYANFEYATLAKTLKAHGVAVTSWHRLIANDSQLQAEWTLASQCRLEQAVDSMEEIADEEPDVRRAELKIRVRQWKAKMLNRAKYGDQVDINVTERPSISRVLDIIDAKLVTTNVSDGVLTGTEYRVLPAESTDYTHGAPVAPAGVPQDGMPASNYPDAHIRARENLFD